MHHSLQFLTGRICSAITEPMPVDAIVEQIESGDYSAELMMQHLLLALSRPAQDTIVRAIGAWPRFCIGCRETGTDVMISYTDHAVPLGAVSPLPDVSSLFLTQDQAETLRTELDRAIKRNNEQP